MYRQIAVGILILSISTTLCANEVVTVPPAGLRTWQEMVAADSASHAATIDPDPVSNAPRVSPPFTKKLNAILNRSGDMDLGIQPAAANASPRSACVGCPGEAVLAYGFQAVAAKGAPPDTMGAVGQNHVMTMLSKYVQIQAKNGSIISTISAIAFWAPLGAGGGHAQLIYDGVSGRWIATTIGPFGSGPGMAISVSDDPTGAWSFYLLPGVAGESSQFPRFGINSTWIAVTGIIYISGQGFQGTKMWVVDKSTALAGGPLTVTVFPTGFDGNVANGLALQPCITLDATEPTLYLVDHGGLDPGDNTNLLMVSQITGTGPSPVWSVVPGSIYSGTGLFRVTNVFGTNYLPATQCPGAVFGIETQDSTLSNTVFRNGRIWAVHPGRLPASGIADRTAAFWYQIDPALMPNPLVQSGVVDGGSDADYIYPSISTNCADDACIGFTRTANAICPEAAFCTRLPTDPLGTMRPVRAARRGAGPYGWYSFNIIDYSWGRYSATVVDPVDDRTFWTIQEYVAIPYFEVGPFPANPPATWGTWWGRITQDCNLNYIPDLCEETINDCNQNGISDACECCHGDVNADGVLNGADIGSFVNALTNQPACAGAEFLAYCRADLNRDGLLSSADIPPFIQQLISSSDCP